MQKVQKAMKFSKVFIISLIICLCLSFSVLATTARDITSQTSFKCKGIDKAKICDNSIDTYSSGKNIEISITAKENIGGLYIKYDNFASSGLLDGEIAIGEYGFIHEYVPVSGKNSVRLSFNSADICDIIVLSEGDLPADIQVWQKGNAKTDLLLCSTHSDDDQLFFAGLLPIYAGVKGANVRVAYFINHFDTHNRTHELLDGLWECGVKNYPDIGQFPDGYSESSKEALSFLESKGFDYDDVLTFQKSLLEKYKPLVVVLHDFKGEYGHGAHILNTESFVQAFESGEGYKPEKVYVHLYKENPIVLDIDTPLEQFDSLTAFQVSQKAFRHHKSQHWTWFYEWLYGKNDTKTHSSQIRSHHPSNYGLYYSRIEEDKEKNCLLENVTLYSEREFVLPETETEVPTKATVNLAPSPTSQSRPFYLMVPLAIAVLILIFIIYKTVSSINKRKR